MVNQRIQINQRNFGVSHQPSAISHRSFGVPVKAAYCLLRYTETVKLIVWKQMCWQHFASKRLFSFKKSFRPCQAWRWLGTAAGNKLHIDKRKVAALWWEKHIFITASRKQECFEREDLTLNYHFCPHTPSALILKTVLNLAESLLQVDLLNFSFHEWRY